MWLAGRILIGAEFRLFIEARLAAGESKPSIGRNLGVSRQAVQRWLNGATQPSRMVLKLAEQLYRVPLDLPPGLPLAAENVRPLYPQE